MYEIKEYVTETDKNPFAEWFKGEHKTVRTCRPFSKTLNEALKNPEQAALYEDSR
jgi:hypothetical protein